MFSKLKSFISNGCKVVKKVSNTITDPVAEKNFVLGVIVGILKNRIQEINKEYDNWVLSYGNNRYYMRTSAYQVFKARLAELQYILDTIRKV